jgi:hypothetical protein
MRSPLLLLALSLLAVPACQGQVDLSGVYRLDTHTVDSGGCGAGSKVSSSPYFMVLPQGSSSAPYLAVQPCADDTGESCDSLGLLGNYQLNVPGPGDWTGTSDDAVSVDGGCQLTRSETTASRTPGGTITIEVRTLGTLQRNASSCSADQLQGDASGLPCQSLERLTGIRVGNVPRLGNMTAFF